MSIHNSLGRQGVIHGVDEFSGGRFLMERRSFLGLAAGAGLSSLLIGCKTSSAIAASVGQSGKLRVGIVGGGMLGASIAMYCARAGAAVTLLEKAQPAMGATSKSLAWINPFHDDKTYMGLRLASIKRWEALDKPLGMNAIWGGHVGFTDKLEDKGRFDIQARELAAYGHPTKPLDLASLKQMSPDIDPGKLVEAYYSDMGGHVDPVYATNRFLAAAKSAGAEIIYPCAVNAIEPASTIEAGVDVVTSRGRLHFDRLIVVTGVDAPALLSPLGYKLPLLYKPGALVHSKPLPIITRKVYDGPSPLEWKQAANGSIVGLEVSVPPRIPVHAEILDGPMEFPPGIAELHGNRILSKFAAYMPALKDAEFDFMTLGFRPFPVDDRPVVGPVPSAPAVSMCVTHSGVTLAPVLGEFIANEVVNGKEESMLSPYRPTRTFTSLQPA